MSAASACIATIDWSDCSFPLVPESGDPEPMAGFLNTRLRGNERSVWPPAPGDIDGLSTERISDALECPAHGVMCGPECFSTARFGDQWHEQSHRIASATAANRHRLRRVARRAPRLAQAWPQKPVRVLVGFAAGGNIDNLARVTCARLAEVFGQQFVVENRVGAMGRSPPPTSCAPRRTATPSSGPAPARSRCFRRSAHRLTTPCAISRRSA